MPPPLSSNGERVADFAVRRPSLREEGSWTEIGQKFPGKRATKQALLKLADELLALDPLPAFVSVQVDWLKRHASGR